MQRIAVQPEGSHYDVVVDAGGLERASTYLDHLAQSRRIFVIADSQAYSAQGERLKAGLGSLPFDEITIELGEGRKRLAIVEELAEELHRRGADRGSLVIAVGGGVAGDVAGFVAASYMRGIDFVQIPTTLLAQVDASVGGKTGVNLATGKNLVGAFHQPKLVLIDPETLNSLPDREYRAGLFEVVKHGIIRSRDLFDFMDEYRHQVLAREPAALERVISESVLIKSDVVKRDEREGGLRKILNYGHTLGHALEAETQYKRYLHGEAIGWGMIAAGRLAELLDKLSRDDRRRAEDLILAYGGIPSAAGLDAKNIAARIHGDKKTIGGRVHFILADTIGQVGVVVDPPTDQVVRATQQAIDALPA